MATEITLPPTAMAGAEMRAQPETSGYVELLAANKSIVVVTVTRLPVDEIDAAPLTPLFSGAKSLANEKLTETIQTAVRLTTTIKMPQPPAGFPRVHLRAT